MFQQILVGCDRGPGTADALQLAAELAQLDDATELLLVHAYPPAPTRFGRRGKEEELDDALHGEGMELLERLRERLPEELRGRVELLSLPVASPAYALHDVASGRNADLIVVGPAQHGPVGRLLLGSESVGIVHGAPCPVAIPPRSHGHHGHAGDATRAIAPIGVGYDGSSVSDEAAELAARLAVAQGRSLDVIGVAEIVAWPPTPGAIAPVPVDPLVVERQVQELLDERIASLPEAARPRAIAVHGSAVDELVERSSELHLLVVGSRDYGPLRHVLLGSVSRPVLDGANCPVLVVPRSVVPDEAA
ncbi:universal stress protein [Patulibacter defluvii]|uniref:universal stress protein n=1 Tax=Patulibacter defluvii TaxID=3095358 RepID=UPI002A752080|nr:universal stress protein [Patulibacter sp. DM4]